MAARTCWLDGIGVVSGEDALLGLGSGRMDKKPPRRGRERAAGTGRPGVESGRSGGVAAAIAAGEEAFDDALDAGHALGQRLHVRAKGSHVVADFLARVLRVSLELFSEALPVSPRFLSEALPVGPDFLAQRQQQPDQCGAADDQGGAHGEDFDEFGGHGRLQGVGLCRRRP